MMKENGKLAPTTKKEIASLRDKIYKCDKCGATMILAEGEFGTNYGCPDCDGNMVETLFED